MKRAIFTIGLLIAVTFVVVLIFKQPPQQQQQQQTKGDEMNFNSITNSISKGALLIDVRSAEEYAQGHIQNAINLPVESIQNGILPQVEKSTELFVYCRSGSRSAAAAATLKRAGFTNVKDLGSMESVHGMGGPIVTE